MELFNLNYTLSNNKRILLQSNINLDLGDDDELCEYYSELINSRHDILHYFISNYIGEIPKQETKISEFFQKNYINGNKSPDIVFERNGEVIIIEISISGDIETSRNNKIEKYKELVNELRSDGKIVNFIPICVSNKYNNILTELESIYKYKENDFDYNGFMTFMDIIEEKKKIVYSNVNIEHFTIYTMSKYNHIDENVKKGIYKDLNIDIEIFRKKGFRKVPRKRRDKK